MIARKLVESVRLVLRKGCRWATSRGSALRVLAAGGLALGIGTAAARASADVQYNRDIRPILTENCFACHGPDAATREAGLRLDVRASAIRTGAIIPGDGQWSEVVLRVTSDDPAEVMPPPASHKTLTSHQKELLQRWIDQGAEYQPHWAFLPAERPEPPAVAAESWVRNPIDRFILKELEAVGLTPAPEADRTTLIRRLSFDLRGLPPSIEEVDAFLHDTDPDHYERVVDRLLASPAYGEKMALHWLDLVRYADTGGYMTDYEWRLWPYRDWVIRAFNQNMPFDQFTIEQLAGDLLPEPTLEQQVATGFNRCVPYNAEGGVDPEEFSVQMAVDRTTTVATAWLGLTFGCAQCHDHKYDPISQKEFYQFYAFLNGVKDEDGGGTYSPVPLVLPPMLELPTPEQSKTLERIVAERSQVEGVIQSKVKEIVYEDPADQGCRDAPWTPDQSLSAWLEQVTEGMTEGLPPPIVQAAHKAADQRTAEEHEALRDHYVQHIWRGARDLFDALHCEMETLRQRETEIREAIPVTMVMAEPESPKPAHVLIRGDFQQRGELVAPDVPSVLPPLPDGAPRNRLGLAAWLTDANHPLVARVTVNRLWAQLFGTGIVPTPGDFGIRGELPSHPELLDWLAVELIESGWNIKALVRTIVCSATYRQSSIRSDDSRRADPGNRLHSRFPRQRLIAEEIRDNALAVSGLLSDEIGGPSVKPYQPEDYYTSKTNRWAWENDEGSRLYRRGLYTFWRRTTLYPSFLILDAPGREVCTVIRPRTNTPLQSLATLNDPAFVEAARVLAQRILLETSGDVDDRLRFAFRLVVARPPSTEELNVLRTAVRQQDEHYHRDPTAAEQIIHIGDAPRPEHLDVVEHAVWTAIANVLLNLDETITKE